MRESGYYNFVNLDILVKFSIYFLWMAAVFDPIGKILGLRYLALGLIYSMLLLILVVWPDRVSAKRFYWVVLSFFCFLMPGYGLIIALFRGGLNSDFRDTSYIASGVLFGCSLVYLKDEFLKTGVNAIIFALRCLSFAIILTFIMYVGDYSLDGMYFFVENEAAYFGNREYGGVNFYYLYFIASPMIIFLIAYQCWCSLDRPSVYGSFLLLLPVAALFLSGTRANMIISIITVPFVILWRRFAMRSLLLLPVMLLFIAVLLVIFPIDAVDAMFSSAEYSNQIKISLLSGYGSIFQDPLNLIFGQGFNAHVWSYRFSEMVGGASKVEFTYIEIFRVFGFVIGCLFLVLLWFIILSLSCADYNYRWLAPAFVLYLFVSISNPYIFSTNGMLPIGLMAAVLGNAAYCKCNKNAVK